MSQTTTQAPSIVDLGGVVRVSSLKRADVKRSPSSSKSSKSAKSSKPASPAPSNMRSSSAPRCLDPYFEDAFLRLIQDRPQQKPPAGQFGSWKKEWPVFWEGAGLGAF